MKHLTLTLEEEVCLLDKYGLTPNELLVVRILLILQDDGEEQLFQKLMVTLKHINLPLREVLEQLQKKEIILKSYKIPKSGEKFDPYAIPINKNFIKALYKSSFEMGKELFDSYPQFGNINGNLIPLRGISKKFDSLEQAYFKYGKSIGFNPEKHKTIIELVDWARENNILNCSLASFIVNEGWHDLNALKNNGDVANINYDAIRIL
nr:hypothetical protein [Bacteroides intestinalis]